MTTRDYIEFIKAHFQSGKRWIEIKTDEPRLLYNRLKKATEYRRIRWHFQVMEGSLFVRIPAPPKAAYTPKKCGDFGYSCKDYNKCIRCRNEERWAAREQNRLPKYLEGMIVSRLSQT